MRFARDVTNRKQADEILRNSEEKYQTLVEELNVIVFQCDAETRQVTYVNRHAEQVLGYPLDRWLNEPDFWADHLHQDDRETAVNFCAAQTKEGRDHVFEYRMFAADGRVVWIHDSVRLVRDAAGRVQYLHATMLDITDRKRTEEALKRRLDFEALLSRISSQFIKLPANEIDNEIDSCLALLGEFMDVDRALVISLSEDHSVSSLAHEWTAPEIEPSPEQFQTLKTDQISWAMNKWSQGDAVIVRRVSDLPKDAAGYSTRENGKQVLRQCTNDCRPQLYRWSGL